MIKFAGATTNTREKINVHCADFDLFPGLNWLHSLRDMQLFLADAGNHPSEADGYLHRSLRASRDEFKQETFCVARNSTHLDRSEKLA